MHYLLYVSSAVVPFSPESLDELLRTSRKNNAANGVSGILLYHDGSFIQYIEGEQPALDDLLSRIRADSRHRGLIVLDSGERDSRVFPEWSMGFEQVTGDDLDRYGAFALTREALDRSLDPALPKSALVMMRTFYDLGHRHTKS